MSEPDRAKEPPFPDRFEAVEPVASTPFERAYQAFDRVLQRRVLLKLPAAAAWDGWSTSVRERLMREARSLAKVRHEGVAAIHWVEETASGPLLVLDLPEGESLTDRLAGSAMSVDEVRELGIQLAEALGAVHYQGIVHRGVGPDTVRVLASGKIRLGTFTFAKAFDDRLPSSIDHRRRLESRVVAHLPAYVAPEQFAGRGADPRSDVFALGCLLFRCLCGKDPFEPGAEAGVLPDPRAIRREVPKDLADVLRKCTLSVAMARYPTAQAVADALKATRPEGVAASAGWSRRGVIAGAGALALVASVGLWRVLTPPDAKGGEIGSDKAKRPPDEKVYGSEYATCHGLFIGIDTAYGDKCIFPELHNPVREIEAIQQRLEANDEQWKGRCHLLTNRDASQKGIVDALAEIRTAAGEEDAVLVYFAGHGLRYEAEYALVAADVNGKNPNRDDGFVRRAAINSFLDNCRAKHILIILDCCEAGALFDSQETRGAGQPVEDGAALPRDPAAPYRQHRVRQILCSSDSEPAAERSPFSLALLEALDPAKGHFADKGFVHAGRLLAFIEEKMNTNRGMRQVPVIDHRGSHKGNFVFRVPKKQ